ncbi:MAG TPA: thiol reductant ABC exporter subunit CydD [Jatrophihabitans sp.]|uniref:thiol reductant ABC exporter subunit CydD n=1 Tax=Jatrophihabitans sp. TaxID=1932789 RepID=UPI002DF934D2|nr:thiol reductant ABC exporter subunit CydD [Jatrophihabitans sp.]
MSRPLDPRLLKHVPAVRRLVVTLGTVQVVAAALTVAQAALLADVVVTVFGGHTGAGGVLGRLVALVGVGVGRAATAALQEFLAARASVRVRADLRRTTLEAVVHLGPRWAARQPAGRLVNATGPGLDALDGYVTRALPALVGACVVPPIVLATITWTDWTSGLALLALIPLVPLFMALIGVTTKRLVERQYRVLSRLSGQFLDLVRGLTTLRVYGQAEAQERTLRSVTEAYRTQTMASLRIAFLSGLALDLIAALSVAVVAVDIGLRLDSGSAAFATALLVLLLAPELFAPLRAVGAQHHASQEGGAAIAAALDIVDEAGDEASAARSRAATEPVRPSGRFELQFVSVVYEGRTEPALAGVDLAVEPGRVVALTGPSGAGKSTVLATLLGTVAPTGGAVLVGTAAGDLALRDLDPDAWRAGVAWLPQRPRPSRPTVADEIRLGDPTADAAVVAAACAACQAPAPGTRLGEDGTSVSAGQRRRIALARALVRAWAVRARGGLPVVLLDEPSEDLDRATEQVVASVISSFAGWATVVVATHSERLAAVADQRVRMAGGRVVAIEAQEPVPVPESTAPEAVAPAEATIVSVPVRSVTPYRLRDLARESGAARRLIRAAALSALAALTGLGLTASSMWLISRAAQHPNVQALAVAVVGVRTFAIGRAALRYVERLVTHDGALQLLTNLRVRVFAALRPLSPTVLGGYGRGDLLRRFVGDVDGAQEGLVRAVVPMFGALACSLGAVTLAAALEPAAGVVLAAGLVVGGAVVPLAAFRGAGSATALVAAAGRRDRHSSALVDALDEVHAYGAAGRGIAEIAAADGEVARHARRPALVAAGGVLGSGATAAVTLSLVLAAAARAVVEGRLSGVEVGVLAVCVLTAFEAVATLPSALVAWSRCRAGLRRVAEVTAEGAGVPEPATPATVPPGPLGLTAADLELAPAPGAPPVLRHAALDLRPGTRLAVMGPSGCGKSTLLAAALRLLPVSDGSLALTGAGVAAELGDLPAAAVPPVVAGSLQGDHVFDATLRDNLRVVKPEASDEDLDALAERVGLGELIVSLPDGWSTPAGPDGATLSGGQRQRLLLARALLADPEVLVLDEPTAHLDPETERRVLDDVLDATSGRTVLMTTHRRLDDDRVDATVQLADGALRPGRDAYLRVGRRVRT